MYAGIMNHGTQYNEWMVPWEVAQAIVLPPTMQRQIE